jgi:hypothetical protein
MVMFFNPEDGDSMFLRNTGICLRVARRQNLEQQHRHILAATFIITALMMEVASSSETSVNFYQTTRRYNPEDSHLHSRRRENLKSYLAPSALLDPRIFFLRTRDGRCLSFA